MLSNRDNTVNYFAKGKQLSEGQLSNGAIIRVAIILGGNFPEGNYPGAIIQGEIIQGAVIQGSNYQWGNYPEGNFPGDNYPGELSCSRSYYSFMIQLDYSNQGKIKIFNESICCIFIVFYLQIFQKKHVAKLINFI